MAAWITRDNETEEAGGPEDTTEVMKLSLDWSLPNDQVPSDINIAYILFAADGGGICNTNSYKSKVVSFINPSRY